MDEYLGNCPGQEETSRRSRRERFSKYLKVGKEYYILCPIGALEYCLVSLVEKPPHININPTGYVRYTTPDHNTNSAKVTLRVRSGGLFLRICSFILTLICRTGIVRISMCSALTNHTEQSSAKRTQGSPELSLVVGAISRPPLQQRE